MAPSADSSRVHVLIAVTAAAAAVTLYATAVDSIEAAVEHPLELAAYVCITLVLQMVAVDAYGRGSISVGGIGLLATGFAFGPGLALAAGIVVAAAHAMRKRRALHKHIFNAASFGLGAAGGATVYHAVATADSGLGVDVVAAIAAGFTFLVVNVGLLTLAMGIDEHTSVTAIWNERFRWLTPHYLAFGPLALAATVAERELGLLGLAAFALPPLLTQVSVRQYLIRTRAGVEQLRSMNASLTRANDELVAMADNVRRTHRDTIAALARSMEAKDYYTGGHIERVSDIAVALAQELEFSPEEIEAVEVGALLHDIGKIGIPERILHKPGPLDAEEWKVMKEHPVISHYILSGIGLHPYVLKIARSSHERIDGAGYPDGLAGDAIPLPARIVMVADAYDALTTDRPYRRARSAQAALAEIDAHAGTQFCPKVVAALQRLAATRQDLILVAETAEAA